MLSGRKPSDVYPVTDDERSRGMSEIEITPTIIGAASLKDAEDAPFINPTAMTKRGVTSKDDINELFYGSIARAQETARNLSTLRKKKIENSNFSSTNATSNRQKAITINVVASSSSHMR